MTATAQSPAVQGTFPDRRVLFAFVLFILVGGGASVAIRITYAEMAPFWAAASRASLFSGPGAKYCTSSNR